VYILFGHVRGLSWVSARRLTRGVDALNEHVDHIDHREHFDDDDPVLTSVVDTPATCTFVSNPPN